MLDRLREGLEELLRREWEDLESKGLSYSPYLTEGSGDRDRLIAEYILPAFAKSYPVSGLVHFIGAGLLSAQLAELAGFGPEEVLVAYIAGVIHDYEKVHPSLASMRDEEKVEMVEYHLDLLKLGGYDTERAARRALHIARTLEHGGTRGSELAIASIVRVSDYILGVRESWDAAYIADLLGVYMERHGLERRLPRPGAVLLGKTRLLSMYASQLLVDEISTTEPLLITPTGIIVASSDGITADSIRILARNLAERLRLGDGDSQDSGGPRDVVTELITRGSRLIDAVRAGKNLGSLIGGFMTNVSDYIKELRSKYQTLPLVDKKSLVVALSVAVAKERTPSDPKSSMGFLAERLGLDPRGGGWKAFIESIIEAASSGEGVDNVFNALLEIAEEIKKSRADATSTYIPFLEKEVSSMIRTPVETGGAEALASSTAAGRCVLCRAPLDEKLLADELLKFKNYIERLKQSISRDLRQEVFHPDLQGSLRDITVLEKVKKLPVCPACQVEAKVMVDFGITGSTWIAVLSYGPVAPYYLLRIVARVAASSSDRRILVDYLSARIVVSKVGGARGLRREDLAEYINLWYILGGGVAVTRDPLKTPDPLKRVVYIDKSDAFFESVDSMIITRLEEAARSSSYVKEKIYRLRFEALRLLQLYIDSLEESSRQRAVRLRPSLQGPSYSPGLTAMSLYSFSRLRRRTSRG